MIGFLCRFLFLITPTIIHFANANSLPSASSSNQTQEKLAQLESSFNGRIGVYAINTANNEIIQHRANERFPVQSTLKLLGTAALLKQSDNNINLLQEKK